MLQLYRVLDEILNGKPFKHLTEIWGINANEKLLLAII